MIRSQVRQREQRARAATREAFTPTTLGGTRQTQLHRQALPANAARPRAERRRSTPIVLSALKDGRIKLELLDLGEVFHRPGELARQGLILAPVLSLIHWRARGAGMQRAGVRPLAKFPGDEPG